MLASLVVYLKPEKTHPLSSAIGRFIHGLFLQLLREGDEELANEYHKGYPIKPFTVSPLRGSFGRTSIKRLIVKDFEYWVRFTFLTKEGFEAFSRVVFPMSVENSPVFLNNEKFFITKVQLEGSGKRGWSGLSSFDALLKESEKILKNAKKHGRNFVLSLRFYSPTTFRRGDISYIFPEPSLVFGSYFKKWNAFSNKQMPNDLLQNFSQKLVLSTYKLHTEIYDTGNVSLQGFKGSCRFTLLEKDKEILKLLIALGLFSFYAGTGQKTTMGMGMTRMVGEVT
jgi:CRISPR-associated endoribonuclease Cas6